MEGGGDESAATHGSAERLPYSVLLNYPAATALAVLVLNDHVFKQHWPSAVTGKLSDGAGLFLCTLVIVSFLFISLGRRYRPGPLLYVACGMTAVVFAAVKTSTATAQLYGDGLGVLRAIGTLPFVLFLSENHVAAARVDVVVDHTDLFMLPFVVLAGLYGTRQLRRSS